jgi:hypothetical protein
MLKLSPKNEMVINTIKMLCGMVKYQQKLQQIICFASSVVIKLTVESKLVMFILTKMTSYIHFD